MHEQCGPQIVMSIRVTWVQSNRLTILSDGPAQITSGPQRAAKAHVRIEKARIQTQGPAKLNNSPLHVAFGPEDEPEVAVRFGNLRVQLQRLLQLGRGLI